MIETNGETNFSVSDLSLAETITALDGYDFTPLIPHNARILNCGSGVYRTLEKDLLRVLTDVSITSIDPSLGVVTINKDGSRTTQGYQIFVNVPHGVVYEHQNDTRSKKIVRDEAAIQFDTNRKKIVTQIPGAVAADGANLPFKNQAFNSIIDIRGPLLYLKQDFQTIKQYISELKRTLCDDGFILSVFLGIIHREVLDELQMNVTQKTKNAFIITK
jgi:hypothetical protein